MMPGWLTCKASSVRHLLFGKAHAGLLRQAHQAVALHTKIPLQLVSISTDAYTQLEYVLQIQVHLSSKSPAAAILTETAHVQSKLKDDIAVW